MGGLVPVREFTSPEEMKAHYAAVRRRCFSPPVSRPDPAEMLALPPPTPKRIWATPSIVPRERVAVRTAAQVAGHTGVSLAECVRISALVADITMTELTGPRRRANLTKARQICSWLGKHYAGASLPQISKRLGGRDHTTALHACRRVQSAIDLKRVAISDDALTTAQALWAVDWPSMKPKKAQVLYRTPTGQFTAKGQPT